MQEAERTFGCFQATLHGDAKNECERACLELSVNKPAVERKPASAHRKENERDGFNDSLVASQNHQKKLDGAKHEKRIRSESACLSNRNEDDSSDDSDAEDPHPKTHQDDPVLSPKPRNGRHPEAQAAAEKKKKSQQRQPPVKKGSRVQVKRSAIVHLLPIQLQKHIPSGDENFHHHCGTAVKKAMGPKPTCNIKLDCFPNGEIAPGARRDKFKTLSKGDDEPPCDPRRLESQQREEEDAVAEAKDAEEVLSEKEFCAQTQEQLRAATTFTHHFDDGKAEDVVWDIKEAGDDISDCKKWTELEHEAQQGPTINPEVLKDLEELENHESHIKRCWPDMTGFGLRMDEHCDDSRADGHCTVKQRRIKFHDAEHEDPDWKLKQAVLLVTCAPAVCGTGKEEFWKRGTVKKSPPAADFGGCLDCHEFNCIFQALPHMWGDKNFWCLPRRDVPWQVFTPFIDAWNKKQQEFLDDFSLLLTDESMVAWVPKTSKLGGLPNCTWEPRKPTPLGTMPKDSAEACTGLLLHADPAMAPSAQDKKEFGLNSSQSPEFAGKNAAHQVHVSESLRQAHRSGCKPGSWIGGDAWVGSVACCLALKLEEVEFANKESGETLKMPLNVESSFVIKNNMKLFPKKPLYEVLGARYGKNIAGNWVAFTTTIKGVPIAAIACAWNNNDVTCVVTTCGNTCDALAPCVCHCPNSGCDNQNTRLAKRPDIINELFRECPVIDGFNNMRQNHLGVELQWPTKDPWIKLLLACEGMSSVNQQRLNSCAHPGLKDRDMTIRDFAGTLFYGLKERKRNVPCELPANQDCLPMKRVADAEGDTSKAVTPKQRDAKRRKGSSRQRTCFICRKCQEKYVCCVGACHHCDTPLCLNANNGREMSCCHEHLFSTDPNLRCNNKHKTRMPKESGLWQGTASVVAVVVSSMHAIAWQQQ